MTRKMDFANFPCTNLMHEPTQAQFAAYQQMFDFFNSRLFMDCLPKCMLNFSRRRCRSHTLFTSEQWHKDAGSVTPEISLNVKEVGEGESIEVMAMLVPEMVNLWQERYGQASRKEYFNREWAKKSTEIKRR
jgi:hypothetical protein